MCVLPAERTGVAGRGQLDLCNYMVVCVCVLPAERTGVAGRWVWVNLTCAIAGSFRACGPKPQQGSSSITMHVTETCRLAQHREHFIFNVCLMTSNTHARSLSLSLSHTHIISDNIEAWPDQRYYSKGIAK